MTPPRPTELAQTLLRNSILEGDVLIDATAGNGHDTKFLAECTGAGGRVLAFDIQKQAIDSARETIRSAGLDERVEFHQVSHARMKEHVQAETVAAVMFNLGYLPGDDHNLTTQSKESLTALSVAADLLKSGGLLSVVCYPGHPEGAAEAVRVEEWMSSLTNDGWRIAKYAMLATRKPAPFLILGSKK